MKPISETPKYKIVWAFVQDNVTGHTFWTLAEFNGSDWVGVQAWDAHQNHNTFEYYDWVVMGWEDVTEPSS